jgi:hypothetical protein
MPTRVGIPVTANPATTPLPLFPGGPLNPVDWMSLGFDEFAGIAQEPVMRGTPGMAFWQRRQIQGPGTVAQGVPLYLHSRPYSRGAGAFSPKFGVLNINPIGSGVPAPYKLPVIAGPGARYAFGAIWFDVQTIPTSIAASPTIPMQSIEALLATSSVAAMYPTTG